MSDQPTYECPAADECPGDPEGVDAAYQRGLTDGIGRIEGLDLPIYVVDDSVSCNDQDCPCDHSVLAVGCRVTARELAQATAEHRARHRPAEETRLPVTDQTAPTHAEGIALQAAEGMVDVVTIDGKHRYWSTWCRHGNHEACAATTISRTVSGTDDTVIVDKAVASCKTCDAPCRCPDPTCAHAPKGP